jgi:leucyl-tRNA synthetase
VDWRSEGAEGIYRFLGRVYRFFTRNVDRARAQAGVATEADRKVLRKLHKTVKKVTEDFESRWHFNTSIAAIMELVNDLYAAEAELSGAVLAEVLEKLALLLGPFAPYLAQELWEEFGRSGPVFRQQWPSYDAELAKEDEAQIVIQVNGKLRAHLSAPFGSAQDVLRQRALEEPKIQPFVNGKQVVKVIVVPDKLVNIVVKG